MGFLERFIDLGLVPVMSVLTVMLILPLPYAAKKIVMWPLKIHMYIGNYRLGIMHVLIGGTMALLLSKADVQN